MNSNSTWNFHSIFVLFFFTVFLTDEFIRKIHLKISISKCCGEIWIKRVMTVFGRSNYSSNIEQVNFYLIEHQFDTVTNNRNNKWIKQIFFPELMNWMQFEKRNSIRLRWVREHQQHLRNRSSMMVHTMQITIKLKIDFIWDYMDGVKSAYTRLYSVWWFSSLSI